MTKPNPKYLVILSENEIMSLYQQPYFDLSRQKEYFSLPTDAKTIMNGLARQSRPFFILLWGYFRATHQFHAVDLNGAADDLKFIISNCLLYKMRFSDLKSPSRPTMLKIKQQILQLFGYAEVDRTKRLQVAKKAAQLARQHCKSKIIFKELVKHVERERLVLPAYSVMQNMLGATLSQEQNRLSNKLKLMLSNKAKRSLRKLLETDADMHLITEFKHDLKNFSCKEIKRETRKLAKNQELYFVAKKILPKLKISKTNISYYASLAIYYDVAKHRRMPEEIS